MKPKRWKVESCADGSLRVYPPWYEAQRLLVRLALAKDVARVLNGQIWLSIEYPELNKAMVSKRRKV